MVPCSSLHALFGTQAFHRVHQGRSDALVTDGQQGNAHRQQTCQPKHPPRYVNLILEVLQPVLHGQVSNRGSNDDGNQHQLQKVFGQQSDHTGNRCTQHLANADFLGALLGGEGG